MSLEQNDLRKKKNSWAFKWSETTEKISNASDAVDCSSAFSREKKGLTENEKWNIVFEVMFEDNIFLYLNVPWGGKSAK